MNDEKKVKIVNKPTITTDYNGPPIYSARDINVESGIVLYHSSSSATFDSRSIIDTASQIIDQRIDYISLKEFSEREKIESISKEQLIEKLSTEFKKNNLVFVFGAGISECQKAPKWDELLQKLLTKALEKDGIDTVLAKIYAKLYLEQFSKNPLITAKYIRKHIGNGEYDLEQETRNSIYENIDRNKSSLFKEILKFCFNSGLDKGLDSIITYNYDDLIEHFCDANDPVIKYNTRHSKRIDTLGSGIGIFHVHGFLPEWKTKFTRDDKIILSEETYHEQYTDIYRWSNLIQIEKFMNKTCLFMGMSFRDPNLRRLLQIACDQSGGNQTHYFIDTKEKEKIRYEIKNSLDNGEKSILKKIKTLMDPDKFIEDLIEQILDFEVEDRDSFGIKTYWIDKWDKLPEILKEIRQ